MLYTKFIKLHFRTMMQYKTNTIILAFSSVLTNIAEFMSIVVLFSSFKQVGEWTFYEAALTFGMVTAIFSSVECFARGFDEFSKHVTRGDLDRMLVRPINIFKQLFCCEIEYFKIPKILLGLVISIFALINLSVKWSAAKIIVLIASFVGGAAVLFGVTLIGATLCFFTIENMEFVNIITNGGKELCYYPINIYNKWLRRFFTFIIPLACFNYLPISYIMGYGNLPRIVYALSPLLGFVFVVPCILFFLWGLKHYQSSGT